MVAAVLVRRPAKLWAPCRAGSIRSVISLKVVSMRLRHSAMALRRVEGMAARCFLLGGTRTAVPRAAWDAAKARPLKPLSASRSRGAAPVSSRSPAVSRSFTAAGTAAQARFDGEPEAVEPLGVRGVAAEPGGQVVAGPGPAVRAADPGWVLDRQRGRIHLLAVVLRQPGRQRGPELLERAPQPAGPAVGLALVRQVREQVAEVPGDLGQEPCLAAPA